MKGLCHECFKSNMEVTISEKTGMVICMECNKPEIEPEITESAIV